jgi:hypothetical protein
MPKFLHDLPDFKQLIAAVSDTQGIAPTLIEKDYWIMHCLWGLQAQGYCFVQFVRVTTPGLRNKMEMML